MRKRIAQTGLVGMWVVCIFLGAAIAQDNKAAPGKLGDAKVVKKGENLVEVTVTGQGTNKDDAVRDAQRKAVENGAGTFIYSQSQTKDFALVKDTILARSRIPPELRSPIGQGGRGRPVGS